MQSTMKLKNDNSIDELYIIQRFILFCDVVIAVHIGFRFYEMFSIIVCLCLYIVQEITVKYTLLSHILLK